MVDENRITVQPQDHPALVEAVRSMRRAQAWAVVTVDREITVGIEAPQIGFARNLPKVSLIAKTVAEEDINYTLAFFQCAGSVIASYLEALKQHRDAGRDGALPGEQAGIG